MVNWFFSPARSVGDPGGALCTTIPGSTNSSSMSAVAFGWSITSKLRRIRALFSFADNDSPSPLLSGRILRPLLRDGDPRRPRFASEMHRDPEGGRMQRLYGGTWMRNRDGSRGGARLAYPRP